MKATGYFSLWISLFLSMFGSFCAQPLNAAAPNSDEINSAILLEGSIPLTWENDAPHPWEIENGKLRSTNAGNPNTASRIAFSYSSEFPSTLTFKTENNYSGYQKHYHYVYVDGERIDNEYSTIVNSQNFRLPKGNHTIMVRDSLYDTSGNYYTSLYAVKVTEQKGATSEEINKAIVKAGSVPLTWISDSNYPWIIEDEKLQSNNYGFPNSASETSFNFNTTKPTEVRFSFQDNVVSSLYHYSQVYVDGNFSQIHNSSSAIASAVYRLPIGNHTIMIRDSIKESSAYSFITHLWDVSVIEIPDLEDVILSANSKPLTFENNDENSP